MRITMSSPARLFFRIQSSGKFNFQYHMQIYRMTDRKIEFYWECKNCTRLSPSVIRTFNSNIANYERNRNPSYKIKLSLTVSLNNLTLNFKWRELGIPPNSAHMRAVQIVEMELVNTLAIVVLGKFNTSYS